jgi:hypothetical protein
VGGFRRRSGPMYPEISRIQSIMRLAELASPGRQWQVVVVSLVSFGSLTSINFQLCQKPNLSNIYSYP